MTEDELRRRIGMYGDIPFEWIALRQAYILSSHEPIILNMGDHFVFFGVTMALAWAEREAERML